MTMSRILALATAGNLLFSPQAYAYIDPGTGTMLLQGLGALLATALFYARSIRSWIAAKLGTARATDPHEDADREAADEDRSEPG